MWAVKGKFNSMVNHVSYLAVVIKLLSKVCLFSINVISFFSCRTENNIQNDFIDTEITITGGVIGPTLSQSYEDGQNTTFSSTSDKISVKSILRKPEVI